MLRRDKSVIAASGRNRLSLDGRRSNSPLRGFGQGRVSPRTRPARLLALHTSQRECEGRGHCLPVPQLRPDTNAYCRYSVAVRVNQRGVCHPSPFPLLLTQYRRRGGEWHPVGWIFISSAPRSIPKSHRPLFAIPVATRRQKPKGRDYPALCFRLIA